MSTAEYAGDSREFREPDSPGIVNASCWYAALASENIFGWPFGPCRLTLVCTGVRNVPTDLTNQFVAQ